MPVKSFADVFVFLMSARCAARTKPAGGPIFSYPKVGPLLSLTMEAEAVCALLLCSLWHKLARSFFLFLSSAQELLGC
jgi:hypothetical protein